MIGSGRQKGKRLPIPHSEVRLHRPKTDPTCIAVALYPRAGPGIARICDFDADEGVTVIGGWPRESPADDDQPLLYLVAH